MYEIVPPFKPKLPFSAMSSVHRSTSAGRAAPGHERHAANTRKNKENQEIETLSRVSVLVSIANFPLEFSVAFLQECDPPKRVHNAYRECSRIV